MYFKKHLNKKQKIFCIGSGWAHMEYFLSDTFRIVASDYDQKYVDFFQNKRRKNFQYFKHNILLNNQKVRNENYNQVIINNIEYLFNDKQMNTSLKNIKKLSKKSTNFFYIFRSRDSFLIKIIDKYLAYFEVKIIQLVKMLNGNYFYVTKNHHGYRRYENEFLDLLRKNNFEIISIHKSMYQTEYDRLTIVRKLKLGKILSFLFLKSHPYLNIIKFRLK